MISIITCMVEKNQPNCFEIINLLSKIRAENNYDSISYLEELYLIYLPLHRINWNQSTAVWVLDLMNLKNLLTSFRMTFLDAGMNKLNWDITQKFSYLKSQEIDGWFENRLIAYEQEKLDFQMARNLIGMLSLILRNYIEFHIR
ncbi:MAG: hypothetical protein IPN15_15915 [Saprospiraceae bacterium]|nr:hypothetical protein [Candidatus Vicinibacter affinis]